MKTNVLGLACLASLAAPAMAAEPELQQSHGDNGTDAKASLEVLNIHNTYDVTRHDDVTAKGHFTGRYWDIGVHLDTYMALDGNPGTTADSFEVTEFTGRLDYLFEMEGYFQILPFYQGTVFPDINGRARFNWLGTEAWYMTPLEGLEVGGQVAYNLHDDGATDGGNEHHWWSYVGGRYFYQDAPLDLVTWANVGLGSRSYHEISSGTTKQGLTTVNIGAKATLPLPWEETWAFLRVEGIWWPNHDDQESMRSAGQDPNEIVIGVGAEWHME